ncbi:MAG: xanthine dehydrogenase family protein molybdopterin-binding subunit [Rhodospirillaceae bacterium]|jgi:aerobic carbon-monoxide dehydrogenase large subunit|nr:xanthine dehydrogenase family protein molybdopterin-binding subunit [Rhodospirillaceae bacterium]MBT5459217.1 xanthine dehydrogenase family protein molybdopterin-binding subunit [Rhodospirillaceae bacterium]
MGEFAIGQPVPREEDPRLLTGGGDFLDDVNLRDQTWGHVLRSPHAHAKISSIDISVARAAPGVIAVLTGEDWMAENYGTLPCEENRKKADGSPMFQPYRGALVTDRVRFVGDYVAFVVAETRLQARDAAELIHVTYEPLPSVSSVEAAIAPGAQPIWDENPDNFSFTHAEGDLAAVDSAFAAADHVVSHKLVVNRVAAVTMEPRGCLGDYDRRSERYTLYTGLQNPHPVRYQITQQVFGIPETQVRVVPGDVGGSFGMRGGTYPELLLVLWASRLVDRPVKWVCDRSEGFMSDDHGRDNVSEYSIALDRDGVFLAVKIRTHVAMGAYLAIRGPRPTVGNLGTLCGVYKTPVAHVETSGVFTNCNCTNPYRGSGAPEAAYIGERLVDIAARELGMDPVELRRRNYVTPDQMPWTNALGYKYDCGDFPGNMEKALEAIDYGNFETRRAEAAGRGKLRGIGVSNTVKKTSTPNLESCDIRFDPSGTVTVLQGTISHGQGHETIFKQIICGRLGIEPGIIRYVQGDTDLVTYGRGTFNSRSTAIAGSAAARACEKIIAKATTIAAHILEASETDIEFDDGTFTVAGTDRSLTLIEVAKQAFRPTALPPEIEPGLDETGVFTPQYWNWPTGVQICELEIDPDTGATEMVGFVCVDDVGTVVNPLLLKAQMHGGIAQGVGQALMENIAFDADSGQLISGSFMDYCLPRADDFCNMEIISAPIPTESNLIGAKGGGESGPTGALPTTINAVVDALKPLGVTHMDMPATPERIWQTIQAAKSAN